MRGGGGQVIDACAPSLTVLTRDNLTVAGPTSRLLAEAPSPLVESFSPVPVFGAHLSEELGNP